MTYSRIMDVYPPLSAEDEKEMIASCGDDIEKRNQLLVLHNISLAYVFIRKWHIRKDSIENFISLFVEGMMNLVKDFDPNKGKFSSYILPYIQKYISYGRGHYLEEDRVMSNCYHLDNPLKNRTSKDEGEEVSISDFLQKYMDPEDFVIKPIEDCVDNDDKREFCQKLCHDILSSPRMSTTPYKRKIFKEWFMSSIDKKDGKQKTYKDIGDKYGITREAVRQNIERSLTIARDIIRKRYGEVSRKNFGI